MLHQAKCLPCKREDLVSDSRNRVNLSEVVHMGKTSFPWRSKVKTQEFQKLLGELAWCAQ